jgi:aminoglycoside phosphotransferase (APT) family kinase protein
VRRTAAEAKQLRENSVLNSDLGKSIVELIGRLLPGAQVEAVDSMAVDAGPGDDATEKAVGYGAPARIRVRETSGHVRDLVLHRATANDFGHDRRADRAQEMLLAFDTFASIADHVRPLDVGVIDRASPQMTSLRSAGEFYLLTEFAPGALYADDLRRIAHTGAATAADVARAAALARYLARLHSEPVGRPALYRRAIRDLVGHGEGIFGIVDGYPAEVPAASPARLAAIEAMCARWRWRLRGHAHRLRRTHGDFHPFNILFAADGSLALLDASRGCQGDPADDVTCLAINYVFFALPQPGGWGAGFCDLWRRFFATYLEASDDRAVLEVAPPFLAWRALVLANPVWYPDLSAANRDALLTWVEEVLEAGHLDLADAEARFQ